MKAIQYFSTLKNVISKIRDARGSKKGTNNILDFLIVILLHEFAVLIFVADFKFSYPCTIIGLSFLMIISTFVLGAYHFYISQNKHRLLDIITLICLGIIIFIYSPFILLHIVYSAITRKTNLVFLSKSIELMLSIILLLIISGAFIFAVSEMGSSNKLAAKLLFIIVLIIFNFLKILLVWLCFRGPKNQYSRYKIHQELRYLGEFFISICIFIKHIIVNDNLDFAFSVFVIITAWTAIKRGKERFGTNAKYRACLQSILCDLENCNQILSFSEADVLHIRFNIDTTYLSLGKTNGNSKITNAIKSLYEFLYEPISETDNPNIKKFRLKTHQQSKDKMQEEIYNLLNELVRALPR